MYISRAVVNARIVFEEGDLALIHIPLDLYPLFILPILRVLNLFGTPTPGPDGHANEAWAFPWPFANLSFTPIEVSLMLPRPLITPLFESTLAALSSACLGRIIVSTENYAALRVAGSDMQAGQRVIDLSAPLAMAGISIFFVTSYGSDFILVPSASLPDVVGVFEKLGFVLKSRREMLNTTGTARGVKGGKAQDRRQDRAGLKRRTSTLPPASAAARDGIKDWQTRMFRQLKRHGVTPSLDPELKLASTSVVRSEDAAFMKKILDVIRDMLVVSSADLPKFLSLTLSDTDSMSITMDQTLLARFGKTKAELDKNLCISRDTSVPIIMDLRKVPHDRDSGIVCAVASRLLQNMDDAERSQGPEGARAQRRDQGIGGGYSMGYVSTVRGGSVLLRDDEVEDAKELVNQMRNVDVGKYDEVDPEDEEFEFHFELELD